jgi:hypothetical protein
MRTSLLVTFLLISYFAICQDNNTLARIAYEDAETALSNGNYSKAIEELNNVDRYLGKVTPKAQYLRVQAWSLAAQNPSNISGAINACKTYLDLAGSFELPEEKVMEVTRLIKKLQQDAVDYEKQLKAAEADKIIEKKEIDFLRALTEQLNDFSLKYSKCEFYKGIDLATLRSVRPDVEDVIKKGGTLNSECHETYYYYPNANKWKGGPGSFTNNQAANVLTYFADFLFNSKTYSPESIDACAADVEKIKKVISDLNIRPASSYLDIKSYTLGKVSITVEDTSAGFKLEIYNGRDMGKYPCLKTYLGLNIRYGETPFKNFFYSVGYTRGSMYFCNTCTPW